MKIRSLKLGVSGQRWLGDGSFPAPLVDRNSIDVKIVVVWLGLLESHLDQLVYLLDYYVDAGVFAVGKLPLQGQEQISKLICPARVAANDRGYDLSREGWSE